MEKRSAQGPALQMSALRGNAVQGFEPAGEVIVGDEVGETLAGLVAALIEEAPDRCGRSASPASSGSLDYDARLDDRLCRRGAP